MQDYTVDTDMVAIHTVAGQNIYPSMELVALGGLAIVVMVLMEAAAIVVTDHTIVDYF